MVPDRPGHYYWRARDDFHWLIVRVQVVVGDAAIVQTRFRGDVAMPLRLGVWGGPVPTEPRMEAGK